MQTQRLATLLGYAGLIPFIVFSLGTWIALPLVADPLFVLITYAAVILSFMGAIYWGLAMRNEGETATVTLGMSVIPALLAWLALSIPALYGLALLTVCFSLLCIADKIARVSARLPDWYISMRVILTTVVVLCLISAMLAVTLNS